MLLAGDGDDDLIKVPFVTTTGCAPTDAVGKFSAEFQTTLSPGINPVRVRLWH
jgi:hypothetical protein